MKIIEEKAKDYADSLRVSDSHLTKKQIEEYAITDFLAGYKAAQEWISVDDELPDNETQIVMKNTEWVETMFYTLEDEESLKTEYTHWKQI